ncbi:MAG: TadE family protein [Microbacterium sp.]
MRRSNRWNDGAARAAGRARRLGADESGAAALEFIAVGVLMLVPLTYLVIVLGAVQSQALGVEAAARFAARTVSERAGADPERQASAAVATVAAQYEIAPERVDVTLACTPAGAACPSAGATVTVTVRAEVPLPFVPPVLGLDRVAQVPVEAVSAQKVSRYWAGG